MVRGGWENFSHSPRPYLDPPFINICEIFKIYYLEKLYFVRVGTIFASLFIDKVAKR